MTKLLVCVPVVVNPTVLNECLRQILWQRNIHIIILLNGADQEVKDLVDKGYRPFSQVTVWENEKNMYVNSEWNRFMAYFLEGDWDRVLILNSDVTLHRHWKIACEMLWSEYPDCIITPTITDDKNKCFGELGYGWGDIHIVPEGKGVPGIFIPLTKEQIKICYPIPEQIKVWFGDAWLLEQLSAAGYSVVVADNLLAHHHTSSTVKSLSGIHEIIEQDKICWQNIVEPMMQKKIKQLKNGM